jgi:DNA-binding protein H-NS
MWDTYIPRHDDSHEHCASTETWVRRGRRPRPVEAALLRGGETEPWRLRITPLWS